MTQPTIDTPDGQRGVVSAQVLLATVPLGTSTVTTGIPPNTETLAVLFNAGILDVSVTGVQTGASYPYVVVSTPDSSWVTIYVDVSAAVDNEVTIAPGASGGHPWYVYADAGVHIVSDPTLAAVATGQGDALPTLALQISGRTQKSTTNQLGVDLNGSLFAVTSPPGNTTYDHPPVELEYVGSAITGTGAILAAPGAGIRYRVFSAQMSVESGSGGFAYLAVGGTVAGILCSALTGQVASNTFPLTGIPIAANTGIESVAPTGIEVVSTLCYTTETV